MSRPARHSKDVVALPPPLLLFFACVLSPTIFLVVDFDFIAKLVVERRGRRRRSKDLRMSEIKPELSLSTTSLNGEHKLYWIKCSDGLVVSMGSDKLEFLFHLMPTLRFLLMGHPSMRANSLSYDKNGVPILEIPGDLCVSQDDFCLLVNVVFEAVPLPPRNLDSYGERSDLLTLLEKTMATLGGCEALAQRLNGHHANPRRPEEDTNDDYDWHVLHVSHTYSVDAIDMKNFSSKGFSYAGFVKDGEGYTSTKSHFYRKKKV